MKKNEFTFIWDLPGKYLAFFGILLGMILPGFCLVMCYSVGMRKELLGVREKTTDPTFTHPTTTLLPSITHPLSTLCRPCFRKGMWYKETVRKRQVQE